MEWQQLVGFSQVAKLGSFTKAGEATYRSQSALSQQIKALEEELDCRLLERLGRRKLRLTEAGELFLSFAETVLGSYEHLTEELQALRGLAKGRLRLAAPFTTLYHLFRTAVTAYAAQFPQVQLTILDRSQPQVVELVAAGDIDLGIALESAIPPSLARRAWHEIETFLMAPLGHPLTRVKKVSWKDIAAYPLILPPLSPRPSGRRTLEDRLRQEGLQHRVVMESSNVELSSLYVEMGLGIPFASLAKGLPFPSERKLAFLPLGHYFPADVLAVAMRKDKGLTPYQEAFVRLLLVEEN